MVGGLIGVLQKPSFLGVNKPVGHRCIAVRNCLESPPTELRNLLPIKSLHTQNNTTRKLQMLLQVHRVEASPPGLARKAGTKSITWGRPFPPRKFCRREFEFAMLLIPK